MDIVCRNSGIHYKDVKNIRYKIWMVDTDGGRLDKESNSNSYYPGWMSKRIGEFEKLNGRGFNQDDFTIWLEEYVRKATPQFELTTEA